MFALTYRELKFWSRSSSELKDRPLWPHRWKRYATFGFDGEFYEPGMFSKEGAGDALEVVLEGDDGYEDSTLE